MPTITENPLRTGLIRPESGDLVHWETLGNPDGVPVLYLHGGPGSGTHAGIASWFDPQLFHAVLMDQRGSGLSTPSATDPSTDLSTNTTQALIADMEKLRLELGVDQWIVFGLSWGTTLGLAYAQAHPERVSALVLGMVTTTSRREVDWISDGVGTIFPEAHARLLGAIPGEYQHLRTVEAYAKMLNSENTGLRHVAALEWCHWEDAHISLAEGAAPNPRYADPEFRYQFARLVTHYWSHNGFLGPQGILDSMSALNDVPGHLIHGRQDVSGPLSTAEALHQAWKRSALTVIDDEGHGGPDIRSACVAALLELV